MSQTPRIKTDDSFPRRTRPSSAALAKAVREWSTVGIAVSMIASCDTDSDKSPSSDLKLRQAETQAVVGDVEENTEPDAATLASQPYSHPAAAAIDVANGGLVPFAETQDDPEGKRYAIQASLIASEEAELHLEKDIYSVNITALSQRVLSAHERKEFAATKRPRTKPPQSSKLASNLANTLSSLPPHDPLEVWIGRGRIERPTITALLKNATAFGEIETLGDYSKVRSNLLVERRSQDRARDEEVAKQIEATLPSVVRISTTRGLYYRMSPADIASIATLESVSRVALVDATGRPEDVTGQTIRDGHQSTQFFDDGYHGDQGPGWDVTFTQVEEGGADDEHKGYLESSGGSSRIRGMFQCLDNNDCPGTVADFSSSVESNHASAVAGIVFGDLSQGQDPNVTGSTARLERTGVAKEARGYLAAVARLDIAVNGPNPGLLDLGPPAPALWSMSQTYGSDEECRGDDINAQNPVVNDAYEEGIFVVTSAGNDGTGSGPNDCTVSSPSAAIGAFTVGAIGPTSISDPSSEDEDDVRTDAITSFSARGGTSTEGGGRSIIDLVAYGCRNALFTKNGGYDDDGGNCGTSYAAPTVSGTALSFIDWYENDVGDSLIDDPGHLFTSMLLMGDRANGSSSYRSTGFSNRYGAGRLRARMFSNAGLDNPWGWGMGSTCVDDGHVNVVPIDLPYSSDVESLKVVLWWYTPRHETQQFVDDVDLVVVTRPQGVTLASSLSSDDNKERVFLDPLSAPALDIEIIGADVRYDGGSCGTNSVEVYWSWFYEDSDRESWENLDDVWTEDDPGTAP